MTRSEQKGRDREDMIFAAILRAARAGARCPTNTTLAESVGYASPSAVVTALGRLEQAGRIAVTRFQCGRVIHLVEQGISTTMPGNTTPHWRDRHGAVST